MWEVLQQGSQFFRFYPELPHGQYTVGLRLCTDLVLPLFRPLQWWNPRSRLWTPPMKHWEILVCCAGCCQVGHASWRLVFVVSVRPQWKRNFKNAMRIWHIEAVFKHERFCCAQRTVFEAWTSNNCNIGRFYFVAQVVAKLDMLHGGLLLLFQCTRIETKLQKTMRISTLNRFLIIKHFLYAQMIGRAAVCKGPRCTLFQTVVKLLDLLKVQAVAKLDMLHLRRLLFWLLKCRCTCAEKHSVKNNHDFQ